MVIVEFVGLPGAGKSAVAALVGAALSRRGVSWGDRASVGGQDVQRAAHYLRLSAFYLRNPGELAAVLRLALMGASLRLTRLYQAIRHVSVWSYRLSLARQRRFQVLLLDQGVIQSAWSLMLRGPWRREVVQAAVSRIILGSGLPHILVHFDVGVDVAVRRISHRPSTESRFDILDSAEAERQLAAQGKWLEQLFIGVVDHTGVKYCRVDATQPLSEVCSEVEAFIGQAISGTNLRPVRIG